MVKAIIGILLEIRRYQDRRVAIEEDTNYTKGPKANGLVTILNCLKQIGQ